MSEQNATYPSLTPDQKLTVRDAQFAVMSANEKAQQLVQTAQENLGRVITEIADFHKVNKSTTSFNRETLEFVATM
jgi:hypothetical protein